MDRQLTTSISSNCVISAQYENLLHNNRSMLIKDIVTLAMDK